MKRSRNLVSRFITKNTIWIMLAVVLLAGTGCSALKKNSCGCPNKKGMVGY
jgi:hypothetical protein